MSRIALVLGHGAGGSVSAPDLQAVRDVALDAGVSVALVEQPYRVAGRRSAPPAPRLDSAWRAVCEWLLAGDLAGRQLIVGGRSSGARVACRTAATLDASAVLCLAFPLQPPRRASGTLPDSRLGELEAVEVPTLIVQGERDRFGMVPAAPGRSVAKVAADHALRGDLTSLRAAVGPWLSTRSAA